jgi:hypothetical protein
MNARDAVKISIDTGDHISMAYLDDLSDADLMRRPCQGCNHINWQVGHLIASEHGMMEQLAPGSSPALPEGFVEKYAKTTSEVDDPHAFCTKNELLTVHKAQREATLAILAKMSDEDLGKPTGVDYAPTVASMFSLQGLHWLMHSGQWVVVRRELGRKPLF